MTNEKKVYTIFAGINGAGKSTLYQVYCDENKDYKNIPRINFDDEIKKYGDAEKAADVASDKYKEYRDKGLSFSKETVVPNAFEINAFKRRGYKVNLCYVGLCNVDLAKQRVALRVSKGGHGVPAGFEKQYNTSLEELEKVLPLCDQVKIYDNTDKFSLICEMNKGEILYLEKGCKWFDPIIDKYQQNLSKGNIEQNGMENKSLNPAKGNINDSTKSIQKRIEAVYKNKPDKNEQSSGKEKLPSSNKEDR